MHESVKKYNNIVNSIKQELEGQKNIIFPKIIAVSKTFQLERIIPLIEYGHLDYGENKVQEALDKWSEIKNENPKIKLHLIGGLQTNKVKFALRIFDYIHSVDSKKLAKKIADEQIKQNKKVKLFIQVNIGNEEQKSGVSKIDLVDLFNYCKDLNLEVVGLMCIPPVDKDSNQYFKEMNLLNQNLRLKELSMGMSSDFLKASIQSATFLRIGSAIFGNRD
ncbi:YggS family pyridoxal phosphate-dependent enzyme [Candidatus Pelagibacter bacterium]|nr:YggS family pyridoxal phosphate-dependent enzyme [Candidatus Pelagibacter bacterium]MDB4217612.1 YggS family pyridoxal phosphate-dependent enzyme [Candidatus Pelagibacter sp.]|tara:strand:+ start:215 stop:874 length:660 start_codon:yes stop_codon:yes gene_type:complete